MALSGTTSAGVGGLVRPAISAATKVAQADRVKAAKVKMKVSVKVKKKLA
jgi:hypothetical protein